ncbi:ClpP/crotonase-like domain-containing protein [Peziza echinospora]|nr:ClpP/crotonase-like domain-containing protein [Peziza echinospora]
MFTALRPRALPRLSTLRRTLTTAFPTEYTHLLVTQPRPNVTLITLNRPTSLNALSTPLFRELNTCLQSLVDPSTLPATRAIVLTGTHKSFAAGADIKEMKSLTFSTAYTTDFIKLWSDMTNIPIPIIAAVNGYALGGGCELAMMADIIYAGPRAQFGQPEVKLGIIPGAGGSQRLLRAVGKGRAMEMILTGRMVGAKEAGEWGLAARVFETPEECVEAAIEVAGEIAGMSKVAVKAAKEVVNMAEEVGLSEGVKAERRMFHALFGSRDQKVGMEAFADKRKPEWTDE